MATEPIAQLRGIRKVYRIGSLELTALRDLDFTLRAGELCTVMGPSGSGKTTLLNILGCLDVPSAGTYELGGKPVVARDFDDLAEVRSKEIGFVFQNFNLVPVLDVVENVELSMGAVAGSAKQRRERAHSLIDAVGLGKFKHHRPTELSGGQQQRVAIARALAPAPKLILADEPTASLDSDTATAILELLVELNRKEGMTILFSTHDPRVVPYANRQVLMRDGKIVDDTQTGGVPAKAQLA